MAKAVDVARRLGITFRNSVDKANAASPDEWGSFTLGTSMTTPLDLAAAYATLGAEGRYCAPTPITALTDGNGRQADRRAAQLHPGDHPRGRPSRRRRRSLPGRPAVGVRPLRRWHRLVGERHPRRPPGRRQDGHADLNATQSFVAVTPQMAAASIAANPKSPTDYVGAAVQRDVIAAVARTLATSLKGQPQEKFTAPTVQSAFGSGSQDGRGQRSQWTEPGDQTQGQNQGAGNGNGSGNGNGQKPGKNRG